MDEVDRAETGRVPGEVPGRTELGVSEALDLTETEEVPDDAPVRTEPSADKLVRKGKTTNLEEDREKARRRIAYALLALLIVAFAGVLLVTAVNDELANASLTDLTAAFITPVIGLVSFVLGFYFGGEKPGG